MYFKPYEATLMNYPLYRVHKNLLVYVPPIFLLLGTVGNVLSVIILTRRRMRKYSAYIYLAVLSVADLLVLHIGLLRMWIGELTGFDIRNQNTWACKLINVVAYAFSDYSGWLICAVTFERWVAVCHAFKMNSFCKKKRALYTILILFVLLLIINAHFLWTVQLQMVPVKVENGTITVYNCKAHPQHKTLIDTVWPYVDACIYSFLPFILILVFNTLIIRQVVHAREELLKLQQAQPLQRVHRLRDQQMPLRVGQALRARESRKITVMLLTISFTFLLTTLPMNLAMIASNFLSKDLDTLVTFRLVTTVTELLMYCNHSLNFFLYCATGAKFRNQLLCLFRLRRQSATSFLGVQELQSVDRAMNRQKPPSQGPLPNQCCSTSSSRRSAGDIFVGRNSLRPHTPSNHDHCSSSSSRRSESHSFVARNGKPSGCSENFDVCNGNCPSSHRRSDSDIIVGLNGHTTRRLRLTIGNAQGTAL